MSVSIKKKEKKVNKDYDGVYSSINYDIMYNINAIIGLT